MSVTRQELFRPESLDARQAAWLGRHTLALGAPVTVLSFASVVAVAAALAILLYGGYARRVELHGVVLPTTGLIQATAPASGRIEAVAVQDNAHVVAGTLLYVLNLETSTSNGDTQQQILRSLASHHVLLTEQIALKQRYQEQQEAIQQSRIDNLQEQARQTQVQLGVKDEFAARLAKNLADYNRYVQTGIGNMNERNNQQATWMRAKDELEELRSVALRVQAQLIEARSQQQTTRIQTDNEIGEMRAKMLEIEQQVAAAEARRSLEIHATAAGTVTALASHPGQLVAAGARVLTIVPDQQQMQAELLAPSNSIGFVHPGQRVRLRYTAFPYQKFGQYWGTLTEVSHAALQADELRALVPGAAPADTGKTFYRLVVTPDRQDVTAFGRPEKLRASMQVDALVLLEARPLYQWILEPLYSLHGAQSL